MQGLKYIPDKRAWELLKSASQIMQDYYPEILSSMYIINANFIFRSAWALCKGFIHEKTRRKINIFGDDFSPALLTIIDAENLPRIYGGTCTCTDSTGDCVTSNVGPWNDFEMVKPKGVRRKQVNEVKVEV